MKLHFNSLIKCAAAILCGASLFACNKFGELEERVDSLESRITALEKLLPTLQGNIDAVQKLFDSQIFITEITKNDSGDEYSLKMSDGNTYTIKQGKIGNTPLISVDEDGYWIVSYDKGERFGRITVNGQDASVTAAPQFRVNAAGNWEISTDGTAWAEVKNTDDNPVPATGDGGDFFSKIEYDEENGILIMTFADGRICQFSVSTDFMCRIVSDEDPAEFSPGEVRTFDVKMRGVKDIYITKPAGWEASLEGEDASDPAAEITAKLTVTAPEEIASGTKISADTDTDLVLHAFAAADDRSMFAKIAVAVVINEDPQVSVKALVITDASITYTITPNDKVTSWKYIHQLSGTEAPTAESTGWTDGTDTELTIGELESETSYTLYVLPVGAEGNGLIVTVETTTEATPIDSYYEAFMAGQDIKIGGKTYNKEAYGDGILISENTEITSLEDNKGIYFIAPEATLTYKYEGAVYKLLLIGDDPDRKSKVVSQFEIRSNPGSNDDGELLMYNIDFDASGHDKYAIVQYSNTPSAVRIIDCRIELPAYPLIAITNDKRFYSEIDLQGNVITLNGNANFINLSSNTAEQPEINIRNNIFYGAGSSVSNYTIFAGNSGSIGKLALENNTFVNVYTTGGMFKYKALSEVSIMDNIIYMDNQVANMYIFRPADTNAETGQPYPGNPLQGACDNNIVYDKAQSAFNKQWFYGGMNRVVLDPENEMEVLTSNPFDGGTFDPDSGTFIPNGTYSGYGSTIGR